MRLIDQISLLECRVVYKREMIDVLLEPLGFVNTRRATRIAAFEFVTEGRIGLKKRRKDRPIQATASARNIHDDIKQNVKSRSLHGVELRTRNARLLN